MLNLCHINYKGSWYGPLWIDLIWDVLCFLDLLPFSHKGIFQVLHLYRFFSIFSFLDLFNVDVRVLDGEGSGNPLWSPSWKIPWMEEPGRLQSMGSQRVGHDWVTSLSLLTFMHWRRKWQPTPVFLPGESQGRGSLVGCHLWGRTELDMTEAT